MLLALTVPGSTSDKLSCAREDEKDGKPPFVFLRQSFWVQLSAAHVCVCVCVYVRLCVCLCVFSWVCVCVIFTDVYFVVSEFRSFVFIIP